MSTRTENAGWTERLVVLASASAQSDLEELASRSPFPVDVFTAPATMLVQCGANPPTCVLIDSATAGVDVAAVVRALHEVVSVPTFVAVWEDAPSKRRAVTALDSGALGLVSMPPSADDLARMVKQSGGRGEARFTRLQVGSIVAFQESRDVWVRETKIHMPENEFGLLWRLMSAFPTPVSIESLRQGDAQTPPCGDDALKHRILRLRRRLEEASEGAGDAVRFIRGAGYGLQEV